PQARIIAVEMLRGPDHIARRRVEGGMVMPAVRRRAAPFLFASAHRRGAPAGGIVRRVRELLRSIHRRRRRFMGHTPARQGLLVGFLVLVVALAFLPLPGARGQDAAIELRYTYKVGRTTHYTTTQTGAVMGADITLTTPSTLTVKQVRD